MLGVVIAQGRLGTSLKKTPGLLGRVPNFELIDEEGFAFGLEDLRGKVWVADFIFTSCAGQCPQMTDAMSGLRKRLPKSVELVSISVDPKRDSPDALMAYATSHGYTPGRWHFLTGQSPDIEFLAREGFHLSYAPGGSPQEPITHSVRFALIDRSGKIRGFYDATDPKNISQLVNDARVLEEAHS